MSSNKLIKPISLAIMVAVFGNLSFPICSSLRYSGKNWSNYFLIASIDPGIGMSAEPES